MQRFALVAAGVFLVGCSTSPQQKIYEETAKYLMLTNASDWSEEGNQSFAEGNCAAMIDGREPAFGVQDQEHLLHAIAVFRAYCPDALGPFLRFMQNGQDVQLSAAAGVARSQLVAHGWRG